MKPILIVIFSLSVFVSCQNDKKQEATEEVKAKKVTVVNDKKTTPKKSSVIIDTDGFANILITSNDIMKFSVKEIKVKAGQKVKLTLQHTGKLDKKVMGHNVVILQKGVKMSSFAQKAAASKDNDYIPEDTNEVIAHTKIIGGGESTTIEFVAPAVGVYDFICSFPAHFAMMKGKFIVE